MSRVTYESIQPLIAQSQRDGSTMRVTFQCPVTERQVQAQAGLRASNTVGSRATSSAKRSLMWSLRSAVAGAVRGALGYGVAGRAASSAASSAMSGVGSSSGTSYSAQDEQDAVVRAFESVQSQFVWDGQNGRFVSVQGAGETMTDFMRQLSSAPVNTPYDRGILARILTHLACADGTIGDDERQFLAGFLTPEMGTVDSLAQMPPPSAAELAETSQGPGRDTMLMLGWALAFTDESLSPGEVTALNDYARHLGIADARAAELRRYAQVYLVDQALAGAYPRGARDQAAHAEVMAMAQRIGLDPTEAERVDIRFRKRYGLM